MQGDEISPRDYLLVIWRRKKFIVLVLGAAILASIVVSLLSKPIYEVSTILKIGRVESQLIMSVPETRELLTGNQLLQETIKSLGWDISPSELRERIKVKEVSQSLDLLKVVVRGKSPQELTEIAQTLPTFVLEEHQRMLEQRVVVLQGERDRARAEEKENSLRLLRKKERQHREQQKLEMEKNKRYNVLLQNLIEATENDLERAEVSLKQRKGLTKQQYLNYIFKINEVRRQLFELQKQYQMGTKWEKKEQKGKVEAESLSDIPFKEISAQPTTIFDPAVKPQQPVKEPRIALNIFLAGVVGLMAGVVLVLLGECLEKAPPG